MRRIINQGDFLNKLYFWFTAQFSVTGKSGLLSAKGGLLMGTKKVGVLSSPRKRTIVLIS